MPGPTTRQPEARLRPAWAAVPIVVVLTVVAARSGLRGSESARASAWRVGRAVPIAVADATGQARAKFAFPTSKPGSKMLVVVSTLARGAESFPLELAARGVDPAKIEDQDVERSPISTPTHRATTALPPIPRPVAALPPAIRTFHLMVRDGDVASASNYLAVTGKLRAVGERVQVYVDDQSEGWTVDPAALADLVATFDTQVFPRASELFGQARDVDGDGRFTVLMSPWLTRLAGGRHSVDGFVRGADFDPSLAPPFSNHCDMMYLSTALAAGPHLRTVIAHEYTHAVTFSTKALRGSTGGEIHVAEEGWLDEGIAHLVEDEHGFSRTNLDYRISAFLSDPERYRLVVDDYYAADLFRSHGNRGAAYLFLRWCADTHGADLIPTLIGSDKVGLANLEAATGVTFEELFRGWSVALFLSGLDPAAASTGGFRSIDLRAPLGGWELAGPRWHGVVPGKSPEAWASAGTSSRFLIVEASETGGVEVEVTAPKEARLQVTAVPLADDLASLQLVAHVNAEQGTLRASIEEQNGSALTLSALAWEPLVPGPNPHAIAFRHSGLHGPSLTTRFGSTLLPARGRLTSLPIEASVALEHGTTLIVKAIGTDAKGRRIAGWATIDTPAPHDEF